MLKQAFLHQTANDTASTQLAEQLWQEIETAYNGPDRSFHNLSHLEHIWTELLPLQPQIADWETLFFSLCYHDVVYDVAQHMIAHDNEQRSADFAESQLKKMAYPATKIARCKEQILATQKHTLSADQDTNFLTDADLSILGQPWDVYYEYRNNIRKEYHIYPDNIFFAGRKKWLEYLLRMEPLFKTTHFYQLYEQKAKENLRKEYRLLQA